MPDYNARFRRRLTAVLHGRIYDGEQLACSGWTHALRLVPGAVWGQERTGSSAQALRRLPVLQAESFEFQVN